MSVQTAMARRRRSAPPDHILQVVLAIGLTAFTFTTLIVLWLVGYNLAYAGEIYAGISVAGISLEGMEPDEAALLLAEEIQYPISGRIVFQDQNDIWIT